MRVQFSLVDLITDKKSWQFNTRVTNHWGAPVRFARVINDVWFASSQLSCLQSAIDITHPRLPA